MPIATPSRSSVEIVSRHGNAVLVSAEEHAARQEAAYLFRSPENACQFLDSYERARAGGWRSVNSTSTTEFGSEVGVGRLRLRG